MGRGRWLELAPMMKVSTRPQRAFWSVLAPRAVVYSEMFVDQTVVHVPSMEKLLDSKEKELVVQLGGCSPHAMEVAAKRVVGFAEGVQELNLNCGCPSKKVADAGAFGASLMLKPELVQQLVDSMLTASENVSVKCRLGVAGQNVDVREFVERIYDGSQQRVTRFVIHAREAVLGKKLSTNANRSIPPLDYQKVWDLQESMPHLHICVNGGIKTKEEADLHQGKVSSVMIGRAARDNPCVLAQIEHDLDEPLSVVQRLDYARQYIEDWVLPQLKLAEADAVAMKRAKRQWFSPLQQLMTSTKQSKVWKQVIQTILDDKMDTNRFLDLINNAESESNLKPKLQEMLSNMNNLKTSILQDSLTCGGLNSSRVSQ